MKVRKRNGSLVNFKKENIIIAIERAMDDTKLGIDHELSLKISQEIEEKISNSKEPYIEVEDIQDLVEYLLMDSVRKDVAKRYIIYRSQKDKERRNYKNKGKYKMITDDFVSKYKHSKNPMGEIGSFVYNRTYSRYIKEQQRREYWWETVRRAVEYNTTLVPTSKEEAEKLYDNIFSLRQFLSGRTFWVGNTEVSKKYPMSNYNCAFQIIDSFKAFKDLFYLLMIGSGVGVRVLKKDVEKIPKIRTNYKLIHKDYISVLKEKREDSTSLIFSNKDTAEIIVGDSKEGWVQGLGHFLNIIGNSEYRNIDTIILDYSNVRPKGERLETFGGTASGHESLKNMFYKIDKVIKRKSILLDKDKIKLEPIDCLDIANIIGENVVVGGVRRTAEMVIIDPDDEKCIEAKASLYNQVDGEWMVNGELIHRQMSNNSIYYEEKPSREKLKWNIEKMRYSGEPGWINAEAALKRRPNVNGVNPCGEILLDSKGLCNLTTVNVYGFIKEDGNLDEKALLEAQRLSARAGYRMTCIELELPEWDRVQRRDKLIGCSLTGWQDMVNKIAFTKDEEANLLRKLRKVAQDAAKEYAKELGQNEPLLVTTIKPEGTLSQLPTVSSGVHYSHSPYFLRRVRISSDDPLVKVCEELGYKVYPEVGQNIETCTTKVVEFPIKAPKGKTKYDISAIEQLENYKMFMKNYVDHNCSITIHVRDDEWKVVEEWVWNNWDSIVALSFLPLNDSFYELLPYEAIGEEEYEIKVKQMKPFIASLISKYENEEQEIDIGNDGCESGICPIR